MYTKEGIIVKKECDNSYKIHLVEHEECKKCLGCKKWIDSEDILEVSDPEDYSIGCKVVVGMDERKLLVMGFHVYMLPVIFLFIGFGVSFLLDNMLSQMISPHRALVSGFSFMLISFYYNVKNFDTKCKNGEIKLKIIKVVQEL